MKKFKLLIFILLISNVLFSQNYKVIYDIAWKPSVENKTLVNDLGVLVINQSKSFFSGYENFRDDSLKSSVVKKFIEGTQKGNLRFPEARNKSKFQKVIFKNLSNDSLTQEEKFFVTSFHINFNCKMNWKMEKDEPKNYFGYTCKKATLNFGGRKWTAWYTTEIPISDGPYKFHGLPGLILSISDSKGEYDFHIKAIIKETNDLQYRNFGLPKPIKLSSEKWFSYYEKYKKQPSIVYENINTENTTYVINGKEIGRNEKNDYDVRQKKYLLENNNEIEIVNTCK